MKRIYYSVVLALIIVAGTITSCKESFLEITPNGALDGQVLATQGGIDGLLIGAYSMLDGISDQGTGGWESASSNWVFGSIRGMEANKGTDSGDQPDINPIQNYVEDAVNPYLNLKWRSVYEAVSRCNSVLLTVQIALNNGSITEAQADSFRRQARTLRGWYHFEAYRMWANMNTGIGIPYIKEDSDLATVKNDVDVRTDILADLDQGRTLPNDMGQVGRFNGTVAKVLWAKAQMQMYPGSVGHAAALPVLQDVAATGTNPVGQKASLMAKYGDVFDTEFRNGVESIYTVQYSVNDGSGGWNGGWGEVLNFPYKGGGSPGGCCGFFNPTQEFVNSFRTSGGLPLLAYYSDLTT
jgi:starch-binding outer membrane protein, SusD/RagB family